MPYKNDTWYTLRVAVVGNMVLAKMWPAGTEEPDWQFRHRLRRTAPGKAGLYVGDCSLAEFRSITIETGAKLAELKRTIAEEERKAAEELRKRLECDVRETPFVLRTEDGSRRGVVLRPHIGDRAVEVAGTVSVFPAGSDQAVLKTAVDPEAFRSDGFPFLLPEPSQATKYRVIFNSDIGREFEFDFELKPARHWTFFINTHTHFDIGFTHPQKEILENLTSDMKKAVEYCEATKDYPLDSRYRWTIEGTGLLWHFINRHDKKDAEDQIKWIKEGRIELCGFNYNMPCEMLGHEELIRCLYWADRYRREYGVPIDTVEINDVPGWAWTLPDLLSQAGIKRASFRANSIRGNFLWYREGAVPRAFYWQGPAGGKILVWYTHTYRDANFFRTPGLHEDGFVRLIQENLSANIPFDYIQLRMGGRQFAAGSRRQQKRQGVEREVRLAAAGYLDEPGVPRSFGGEVRSDPRNALRRRPQLVGGRAGLRGKGDGRHPPSAQSARYGRRALDGCVTSRPGREIPEGPIQCGPRKGDALRRAHVGRLGKYQ